MGQDVLDPLPGEVLYPPPTPSSGAWHPQSCENHVFYDTWVPKSSKSTTARGGSAGHPFDPRDWPKSVVSCEECSQNGFLGWRKSKHSSSEKAKNASWKAKIKALLEREGEKCALEC